MLYRMSHNLLKGSSYVKSTQIIPKKDFISFRKTNFKIQKLEKNFSFFKKTSSDITWKTFNKNIKQDLSSHSFCSTSVNSITNSSQKEVKNKTLNILSIDGGGIRGIIPAMVLCEIEKRTGKPISELFDFIAGTSTGGIIGLGLSVPDPNKPGQPLYKASDVLKIYEENGNSIFYEPENLRAMIIAMIPTMVLFSVLFLLSLKYFTPDDWYFIGFISQTIVNDPIKIIGIAGLATYGSIFGVLLRIAKDSIELSYWFRLSILVPIVLPILNSYLSEEKEKYTIIEIKFAENADGSISPSWHKLDKIPIISENNSKIICVNEKYVKQVMLCAIVTAIYIPAAIAFVSPAASKVRHLLVTKYSHYGIENLLKNYFKELF